MEVIKYKRRASNSVYERICGIAGKIIEEIWVEQSDGKHFVFNSEGGTFFSDEPLGDEAEKIDVAEGSIFILRRYLDARESLTATIFKEK